MLDGRPRRCACAAVVAGDHHVIGLALGNACGNRAHADFGHQLHADVSVRGDVLQVVDQLSQVFDRINIVMWWRRNQTHAWHAVTQLADVLRHFRAWQLTTFTGLRALGHLDLNLVRRRQVFSRHTEAARSHLLDA